MLIVSFTDYVPTPRYDGTPWTAIQIEEGLNDGNWNLIDTIAINPVDDDPQNPAARSFTTELATLAQGLGWYRVSFKDAIGNILLTDPILNAVPTDYEYRPGISRVARKNLSRTRNSFGKLENTFTPDTTPTDTQVAAIISDVLTEVGDVIGDEIDQSLWDDAAGVVAIKAAMQVELDCFSDQVNSGRSIYPQLEKEYTIALNALLKQITLRREGRTNVGETGAAKSPSYSFPPSSGIGTKIF